MLTVLSLRPCNGRGAFSRHARNTLSSVAKVRNRTGPIAAVIRSVASWVEYLVEMKQTLIKRSKDAFYTCASGYTIYLHQRHEDVKAKGQHAEECRRFQVANFGRAYSPRSSKPSIHDGNGPPLEGGRAK